jgi:hypothetical protein
MSMIRSKMPVSLLVLTATLLTAGARSALAAASEDDFKAAYAAAETANKQAGLLRDGDSPGCRQKGRRRRQL